MTNNPNTYPPIADYVAAAARDDDDARELQAATRNGQTYIYAVLTLPDWETFAQSTVTLDPNTVRTLIASVVGMSRHNLCLTHLLPPGVKIPAEIVDDTDDHNPDVLTAARLVAAAMALDRDTIAALYEAIPVAALNRVLEHASAFFLQSVAGAIDALETDARPGGARLLARAYTRSLDPPIDAVDRLAAIIMDLWADWAHSR